MMRTEFIFNEDKKEKEAMNNEPFGSIILQTFMFVQGSNRKLLE